MIYSAISDADCTGDARRFIEFMLVALRDVLVEVKRNVGKGVLKSRFRWDLSLLTGMTLRTFTNFLQLFSGNLSRNRLSFLA